MAMLRSTGLGGTVVFLGIVRDRAASPRSVAVDHVLAGLDGLAGDAHAGLTRPSCSRVLAQYPVRGTVIRNTRQVSLLSLEELAETAALLGIPALPPQWVGANLVLEGLPDVSRLPPSSRLVFDGGAVLTVDMENAPCQIPAREIGAEHPGVGKGYKSAAKGRRGVTAWVERAGGIAFGARVALHVPPSGAYPPLG